MYTYIFILTEAAGNTHSEQDLEERMKNYLKDSVTRLNKKMKRAATATPVNLKRHKPSVHKQGVPVDLDSE